MELNRSILDTIPDFIFFLDETEKGTMYQMKQNRDLLPFHSLTFVHKFCNKIKISLKWFLR